MVLRTSMREQTLWLIALLNQDDKEIYNGQMLLIKLGGGIITTIIINRIGVLHFRVKDVSLVESENKILTKK